MIIGSGADDNKRRPVVIIVSFSVSVIVLTLVLKRLVTQFGILPDTLTQISAVLLFVFGLFLLVPSLRDRIMHLTGLETTTQTAVTSQRQGLR